MDLTWSLYGAGHQTTFCHRALAYTYDQAIYFWTFIREWILGRDYVSWTGRQGRPTEIAPMSVARRHGLAGTGLLMLIPLFVK